MRLQDIENPSFRATRRADEYARRLKVLLGVLVAAATAFALMPPAMGITYGVLDANGVVRVDAPEMSADYDETTHPACTFDAQLEGADGAPLSITVNAPVGALPEGTTMKASLAGAAEAGDSADAGSATGTVLALTFFDTAGNEVSPARQIEVLATASTDAASEPSKAEILPVKSDADGVSFTADSFSVYVLAESSLEKSVLTSDGRNFKVRVDYNADARIPVDAQLQVVELRAAEYEDYLARTEAALDASGFDYARIFDISLLDADGSVIEPAAPLQVAISLLDAEGNDEDFSVVHFAGEDEEPLEVVAETDGNTVSFETDGFSAYAIVQGPSATPTDWMKITSLSALESYASEGLYLGHTDGYYYKNSLIDDGSRVGIAKTKPAHDYPAEGAAQYYFEKVTGTSDQFYIYCYGEDGEKLYAAHKNNNNSLLLVGDEAQKTAFTVNVDTSGKFTVNDGAWYWNMQGGVNGSRFCTYNNPGDGNNKMYIWLHQETGGDPYGLDGKTYGLMSWDANVTGRALLAKSSNPGALDAQALTVMAKMNKNQEKLYVADDAGENGDISLWTFNWVGSQEYTLSTLIDGVKHYLVIDNSGLSITPSEALASRVEVTPGTGQYAGKICLKANGKTLTYSGKVSSGFTTSGSVGSEWLNLVELSELTTDYFLTYSASKVSVSDEEQVHDGAHVVVYTRAWNDTKKKYEFYAIGPDGTLVPCYENGDSIQWVSNRLNTLLWDFVEYQDEATGLPTYYYELHNQYSDKFLAPQLPQPLSDDDGNALGTTDDGQILSPETFGINLNGRRNGQYYTTILAWDTANYAYAGLKVEDGKIVTCPQSEAMDFYFAIVEDIPVDDVLHTVPTVDHTKYGITMKIVDFANRAQESKFLDDDTGGAVTYTKDGLLSNSLGDDKYPMNSKGESLAQLFNGAQEVNHLFIASTYSGSGYYEFDSSQNFASLNKATGDFTVYKELGTMNGDSKPTLKHGQFMPYNDIKAGQFATTNPQNLYSSTAEPLLNSDPRKYEQMYLVQSPNYYFGVELEASFVQTPNGEDAWGHDIIYEFTGDDDFWLYVNGELVIDLGGIHSALPGSVNFKTGEVDVNGKQTTLRAIFEENYRARGASDADVQAYLDSLFEPGEPYFKVNSTNTMRIFYMERGAGASNLHMRFNLASIKPGTVQLSKELKGVDATESILSEFPYQVFYTLKSDGGDDATSDKTWQRLTNAVAGDSNHMDNHAFYKDTITPVKYAREATIGGATYEDVFYLKPGQTAELNFPDNVDEYYIVECGVNTDVFDKVTVNGVDVNGSEVRDGSGAVVASRNDYAIDPATTNDRARVAYVNGVNPDALRTLTIEKVLYREDGKTPISHDEDQSVFGFRVSLGTEYDEDVTLANMHTYHVKDPEGNYCTWDAAQKGFVSLGKGNYADLTDEEKKAASFTTSMSGSIANIPVGYIVEIREVLAGTQYKVEERASEIPDGYSLQKYVWYEDGKGNDAEGDPSANPVQKIVTADADPHVDVCNLKGWGLRVNKKWTDADYLSQRDPAYFGIFIKKDEELHLVPGSLRQMDYGQSTLYWYYLPLPKLNENDVSAPPFNDFKIREVMLESPVVDDDGVVISYGKMTEKNDGDTIEIRGTQKGEGASAFITYTVKQDEGLVEAGSNVRVDEVTNYRPGVVLRKTDWAGNPLPGATFSLGSIGSFTSGKDGQITVAFLSDDKEYTLAETKAPTGYRGLKDELAISLHAGELQVKGAEEGWCSVEYKNGMPVLTVKDRPLAFRVQKVDAGTGKPMPGVTFDLYQLITVNNTSSYEKLEGYSGLKTDGSGILLNVDQELGAGSYRLRETKTLAGYTLLDSNIDFTISETGYVTLASGAPEEARIENILATDGTGTITCTLLVENSQSKKVRIEKRDMEDQLVLLPGAVFDLRLTGVVDGKETETTLYTGLRSGADGLLATSGAASQTVFELVPGTYHLVETCAPEGYLLKADPIVLTVTAEGVACLDGGADVNQQQNAETKVYTVTVYNSKGLALPNTGGLGVVPLYAVGVLLVLAGAALLLRRRPAR